MTYYASHQFPSSGQMSSQILVMSTHHHCGDEMCFFFKNLQEFSNHTGLHEWQGGVQ